MKKAKWIWHKGAVTVNEYADFYLPYEQKENCKKVVFRISSDTNYMLTVNGRVVSYGQYHDIPENRAYDSVDITDYLVKGKNTLIVTAYSHGEGTHWHVESAPAVCFELETDKKIVLFSDENTLSRRSPEYRSGNYPKFSGQLGFAFAYDGTKRDNYQNGFAPSELVNGTTNFYKRPIAKLVTKPQVEGIVITQGLFKYEKSCIPAEREKTAEIAGVWNAARKMQEAFLAQREPHYICDTEWVLKFSLPSKEGRNYHTKEACDGIYVIVDLLREQAGLFHLKMRCEKGAKIDVGFGEHLDDLRLRTFIGRRCFAFELVAGEEDFDFTYYLKRLGCRYLQLFVHSKKFTLYECSVLPADYPVTVIKKDFKNYLYNTIYDVGIRTLRLCMHEHYEDCPWREQALYLFDSRNQMLCGYYAFKEYAMPRSCLKLFAEGLRSDGHLELCAPCRMPLTIPVFSLIYVLAVYEYIEYSGDVSVLDFAFKPMTVVLETMLRQIDKTGVAKALTEKQYWNFYEWRDELQGVIYGENPLRHDAGLSGFIVIALDRYIKLCKKYKLCETADLEKRKIDLINAINKNFLFEDGTYAAYVQDGKKIVRSEFINSVMLYAGIIDKNKARALIEKLLEPKKNNLIECTLSSTLYKYEGILNFDKRYLPKIMSEVENTWGKMLRGGATTFWETQAGADDFYFAGSLCHGWSAIPVYLFNKYISC